MISIFCLIQNIIANTINTLNNHIKVILHHLKTYLRSNNLHNNIYSKIGINLA